MKQKILLIIIIIIIIIISSSSSSKTKNVYITQNTFISQNGIIFQKLGKVDFITVFHNLVISFNSTSIIDSGNNLFEIMNASKTLVNSEDDHYLKHYYKIMLQNIMIEFKATFDKYKRYINNTIYNNVENFDNIIQKIENNNNNTSDEINIIDSYVSKLNINIGNLSKIEQAIYRAKLTYRVLAAHYTNNSHSLYNVSRETIMSFSLTSFEFCLRDFNEEIEQILYKLDSILTTNKNSILIITPYYFQKFLNTLQNNLNLLYPATYKFIPKYYDICESVVRKKNNILYFIIKIPTKYKYEYDLFYMYYMSIPIINLPGWSRTVNNENKKNFLAISTDRLTYTILNNIKDSCISSKICNSNQQIQKTSSNINQDDECLLLSYLDNKNEEDIDTKCKFVYNNNNNNDDDKNAEFVIIDNFWIGSILKDNVRITKHCNDNQPSSFNINKGIVKIPVSSNCTFDGSTFILPNSELKFNNKNNKNNNYIETLIYPIKVNFSNFIISKLFFNNDITYLTSHDINNFKILYNEKSSFINPKINFAFFIIIFVYILILTLLINCLKNLILRKLIYTPPPPPPPPPPPELESSYNNEICNNNNNNNNRENNDNNYNQQQQWQHHNPQYYYKVLPPPLPPQLPLSQPPPQQVSASTPIYEDCDTYIDMQQNINNNNNNNNRNQV